MTETTPSLFTRILAGEVDAEILYEDERLVAIQDLWPQAPVHIVVFPRTSAYANIDELAAGDPELLIDLLKLARRMAGQHAEGEYRLVFNSGATAGQTVFHVHGHVLGGGLTEDTLVTGLVGHSG